MGSSREHAATKTVDDFDLAAGHGALQLKTPWRNGTTHVEWDAVDCIAELAALVPPPRAHFTRVHGVFAPHADLRTQLTRRWAALGLHPGMGGHRSPDCATTPSEKPKPQARITDPRANQRQPALARLPPSRILPWAGV